MIKSLIESADSAREVIRRALKEIHGIGPINPATFEQLAYVKRFHESVLSEHEASLISTMGLFFKIKEPGSLLEEVYSIYSDSIKETTGHSFTPTQADAYKQINTHKYFSFSAPTSAGKSFLFRELIKGAKNDIVIVVPSRALIAEYYAEVLRLVDKSVLVLQFIDNVNQAHATRRIFIITPERGPELFKYKDVFNVEMFLLDEAQISDEAVRGMKFDAFVRRADRAFPAAKKIFAHPFITNPVAQLKKHGLEREAAAKNYNLHTVGKIFAFHNSGKFHYFSPYTETDPVKADDDLVAQTLTNGGTLLVYISKSHIYGGDNITDFAKYIELCPVVTNPIALRIIEELREYIGAGTGKSEKRSKFIELMGRGIVVHHGSMPLKARLLIEEYIRSRCARICFATSTLNQGINMPFDIVWIDNFRGMDPLLIKNLIGRSGRSTAAPGTFDFGYTIVHGKNVDTFKARMAEPVTIGEQSLLDQPLRGTPEDLRDIVEAVKGDSFNTELNLPEIQIERIAKAKEKLDTQIRIVLDNLLVNNVPISGADYYELGDAVRDRIKAALKEIYALHLRRSELTKGESTVLSAAIPILLWKIQGKSFGEIVSLRHSFLSNNKQRRAIAKQVRLGEMSAEKAKAEIDSMFVRFSPIAEALPNINLKHAVRLFGKDNPVTDIDYDVIVYDTYDYLDKVISLSLIDPICAAFEIYARSHDDPRARALVNYLRFGTNNAQEIWLLRYGFDAEDLDWLTRHIDSIDQNEIRFKPSIKDEPEERRLIVSRFL